MPWTDHAGRFSPLKAMVLAFALYPAAWLVLRWGVGDLGPRPLTEAIHRSGDWAVRFLVFALAVTPARAVLDWSRVLLLRRMLGVAAALYAGLHLLLYVADQKWNLWTVASEIVLRFYLTVGFVALLGLAVLAWTSTDGWQRRLRQRWKRLHRLAYPLTGLALLHYALQAKINASDAVLWFGLFVWLMLWRAVPKPQQTHLAVLAALAPVAALLTAVTEVAWYGLATKVPAERVLQANLGFDPSGRPAPW
jgi:methionine sulfoxide reductase heme-binding subunit